ncbi:MAG: cobalamin B12-binding domain-containing protein [Hydrogenophaga sp.]|nr:cobalamin B12-binding domain-containing protein [Hydrogenophaga sp.]MDP2095966.1 cobalamin B12-binding domain-containing protein [Hydrogenophaga sp.]
MTSSNLSAATRHTIADVERDTGLSKDTLRVWERRYGFPTPERDALGERQYDDAQLLRLRHIRRLLDAGHRPGGVVALPLEQLLELGTQAQREQIQTPPRNPADALPAACPALPARARRRLPAADAAHAVPVEHWMQLLRQHQAHDLRRAMNQYLLAHGLAALIRDGVIAMNVRVGQSWLDGQLAVFEEHLYTEVVQALLRSAMAQVAANQPRQPPRVLLTTVPGEPHALGLLMAESFMVLAGCDTVALGVQTPLPDIVAAACAYRVDVVALSFTAVQNPRDVLAALAQLRERLPASMEIWAGGQCPALYRQPRGPRATQAPAFWPMGQLDDITTGVARWRAGAVPLHAQPAPEAA